MHPKVQLLQNILHSQPLHSKAGGTGLPHLSIHCLNVLAGAPAPAFSSTRRIGLWFSCFQWPDAKHPFQTWITRLGKNTGQAHHEIHINIITALSEFTVAMSTKQLGKWVFGKVGSEVGFGNMANVSFSQNNCSVTPASLFLPLSLSVKETMAIKVWDQGVSVSLKEAIE